MESETTTLSYSMPTSHPRNKLATVIELPGMVGISFIELQHHQLVPPLFAVQELVLEGGTEELSRVH